MADVSEDLRTAREQAGLTIEDVSARTRIKPAFLQAIERGEFERLPGEFFTRAFLRTYARELHLSPDAILASYEGSHVAVAPALSTNVHRESAVEDQFRRSSSADSSPLRWARPWPIAALAVAIIVGVMVINRPSPPDSSEPAAIGTGGVVEAAQPQAAPPVKAVADTLAIEIRPTRVMWVTASADGKRVIYRLLQPGERVRLDARNEFSFRVGDAAAFEYSLNNAPGKPLGGPGEVREFHITRENYRDFLR